MISNQVLRFMVNCGRLSTRSAQRLRLNVNLLWGFLEIQQQRRAEPTCHFQFLGMIPIAAAIFGAMPIQAVLMTREGRARLVPSLFQNIIGLLLRATVATRLLILISVERT